MTPPEIKPNVQTIFFIGFGVEDGGILRWRGRLRVTFSGDSHENGEESPIQAISSCLNAVMILSCRIPRH
jgi:hypothetical protein